MFLSTHFVIWAVESLKYFYNVYLINSAIHYPLETHNVRKQYIWLIARDDQKLNMVINVKFEIILLVRNQSRFNHLRPEWLCV